MAGGKLPTTPSQTVGPFFALPGGLPWSDGPDVVAAGVPGAVEVHGRLLDGAGQPVPDGLVELWQADAVGSFVTGDPRGATTPQPPGFRGFGRCATDESGAFWFRTVKPAALPTPDGDTEAPHVDVSVLARGLLHRVVTRLYFPDEEAANAADPVLSTVDPKRRPTLVARAERDGVLNFDIHLQGDAETVFFDL